MPIHTQDINREHSNGKFISKILGNELKMDVLSDLYLNFEFFPREIASLFGVSTTCVARTAKKMGISRTGSEALKLSFKRGISKCLRGKNNPNFKGAYKNYQGYMCLFEPNSPFSRKDGYIFEHRLNWYNEHPNTPKEWVVHHINGIRDDNRIKNLVGIPPIEHGKKTLLNIYQERIRELENKINLKEE